MAPVHYRVTATVADRPNLVTVETSIATFEFRATCTIERREFGSRATMTVEIEPGFGGMFAGIADAAGAFAYRRLLHNKMIQLADSMDGGTRQSLSAAPNKVLSLVQRGRTDSQIAEALGLPPRVVKQHVESIIAAYRVPHRQALAEYSRGEAEDN